MNKRILLSAAIFTGLATGAYAGAVAYVAPAAPVLTEETATMGGGFGTWMIPLIALALIMLAASGSAPSTPPTPSDARIKRDIKSVGMAENGLPLYEFRYLFGRRKYIGVMAQDVLGHTPEAVVRSPFGYYKVNYGMLGLEMQTVH